MIALFFLLLELFHLFYFFKMGNVTSSNVAWSNESQNFSEIKEFLKNKTDIINFKDEDLLEYELEITICIQIKIKLLQ